MLALNFRHGIWPLMKQNLLGETKGWAMEILSTIAVPLSFYLAFGLGLRGHIDDINGVPYMAFVTPGLIALTIQLEAFRTGGWGLWLANRHHKTIQEFRIKPISMMDIMLGEMLSGFLIALTKGSLVAITLFFLLPFPVSVPNLIAFIVMMFPGAMLFTAAGAICGITYRRPDQIAQLQSVVITPLLYLGGLFFPIDAFPESVRQVVVWFPTTAIFDGGRHAFLTGELINQYVWPLWILAVSVFVATVIWCERRLS